MRSAELQLVRYEQRRHFSALIHTLERGKRLTANVCVKSLQKMSPFVSNSLLRVGGRLNKA